MLNPQQFIELHRLNKDWYERHKHLSDEEILERGLIDEADLCWVRFFRNIKQVRSGLLAKDSKDAQEIQKTT